MPFTLLRKAERLDLLKRSQTEHIEVLLRYRSRNSSGNADLEAQEKEARCNVYSQLEILKENLGNLLRDNRAYILSNIYIKLKKRISKKASTLLVYLIFTYIITTIATVSQVGVLAIVYFGILAMSRYRLMLFFFGSAYLLIIPYLYKYGASLQNFIGGVGAVSKVMIIFDVIGQILQLIRELLDIFSDANKIATNS